MLRIQALLAVLAAAIPAEAAGPALGYVVKTDADSVYMDLGEASGASTGQPFYVYEEGEALKHPVTGQSLGKIETQVAAGTIKSVLPLYSIGTVSAPAAEIKAGMRARLGKKQEAAPAPATAGDTASRGPSWRSGTFDFQITGMAVADFNGDSKPDLALSDERGVSLYPYPPQKDEPLARFRHPGNSVRILSLEAGDLDGDGKAELFASLFNETFDRFETVVLKLAADGKWEKSAEFPWLVRAHQDGAGRKILAMQQLIDDKTFPYSTIYPLAWQDGKYAPGKPAIRPKRVDWIYDFTTASLDGAKPSLLYMTGTDLIRVQFEKGYWKTSETYGQTPLRVRWAGRLLSFRPPMVARYEGRNFDGLYVIKNMASLGGLGQPFGLFSSGQVQRKDWNGVSLSTSWQGELGGYATGMTLVPAGDGRPEELAVTVVGTAGKSSIWAFAP
jgi:hypothetical protein